MCGAQEDQINDVFSILVLPTILGFFILDNKQYKQIDIQKVLECRSRICLENAFLLRSHCHTNGDFEPKWKAMRG